MHLGKGNYVFPIQILASFDSCLHTVFALRIRPRVEDKRITEILFSRKSSSTHSNDLKENKLKFRRLGTLSFPESKTLILKDVIFYLELWCCAQL